MKKVILVLLALLSLGAVVAFADEALPEIAPTDEVALPPIDAPAADDAQ